MNRMDKTAAGERLGEALEAPDPSARMHAALEAGTRPDRDYISVLIDRCSTETDFYVREMLTWALARQSVSVTLPLLVEETRSTVQQARSQALHTLSKIGDPRGWVSITPELLSDPDDEVARSAWRAAAVLVPKGAETDLALALSSQIGRGGRAVRRSLSSALVALGDAAAPVLREAALHTDAAVRLHAVATQHLVMHPDDSFDTALWEAEGAIAVVQAPPALPADEVPH